MLHWDWPHTWSFEDRETIRVALENSIRASMAKGESTLVRGMVQVDLPEIGPTPPQIMLTSIRELSLEHTAVMVKVRYDGEFTLKLRGLQVNVDTVGTNSTSGNDPNLAMPFYCPLEMTLSDIHIDGVASIEVFQEIVDQQRDSTHNSVDASMGLSTTTTTTADRPRSVSSGGNAAAQSRQHRSSNLTPFPATSSNAGRSASTARMSIGYASSGYGVLFGAGGRRAMRPPALPPGGSQTPPAAAASRAPSSAAPSMTDSARGGGTSNSNSTGGGTRATPLNSTSSQPRHSLMDLATKRAVVTKRRIKVQLFGDPIKQYRVESNLVAVPGAGQKVEEHIQGMLDPIIERMMTDGINVDLNP